MPDVDPNELGAQVSQVLNAIRATGHEHWWLRPPIAELFEREGYHLVPQHFYGPLPSVEEIAQARFGIPKYPLEPLGWRPEHCGEALRPLLPYWQEFKAFAAAAGGPAGFGLANPFYTGIDAFVLYAMVRLLRPKRLIEIGSGFSTHISYEAMRRNGGGSMTCIDPFPSPKLLELADRVEIVASRVQDVDQAIFAALSMNDICFIDSSHVSKLDSDVNFEIFRILPVLRHRVVVHFYSIFLPFEYPAAWLRERRWFWNEQYLLYAYLIGARNLGIEVVFPTFLTVMRCRHRFQELAGDLPGFHLSGASFWFRIKRPLKAGYVVTDIAEAAPSPHLENRGHRFDSGEATS